ncbi:MAG: hypothetical protein A2X56_11280 [Nitrospirae bacterium GWC2_57_13]|jgi:outer membrane protein|nr:MAG: hypothetical protein A2072_08335 [Nitrospirae bacterium GWC1_57_7]OGW26249.1 MAG: hypothetical protein A2X56_11280 [Nitrospirae bacterium GWC2_57_13]HAS54175.1 hypothetical protein [Nitrospiraceae bacterium]
MISGKHIPVRAAALFAVLLFAAATSGYAAEGLTLEQAVDVALKSNPGLKAADAEVNAAQAGVLRSRSGFLPKVTLSETYSRTNNPLMVFGAKLNQEIVSNNDFDPLAINDPETITDYNTRLSVIQPVFNGGRAYLGVKQARLHHDASLQDRERSRQETVYNVVKGYYGLLLAKEYRRVALQSLATSEANVRLAEARYRAGAVLQSDLLRAKVQLAEVKEMATRAENGVQLAKAALNFAMGVPQSSEYEIECRLSARNLSQNLDGLIEEALQKRPDLLAMNMNRRNAAMGISQARTEYVPTLNVMAQADWHSSDPAGDDAKSWAVMAVLQWNLFDGLVTRSNVKEALATTERMKSLEEQMRSGVQLQVREAFYRVAESVGRIAATGTSVQEAEEGLRIVQKRYEVGMTNFVDVLGAESALIRARTNALQALYDNNTAHAELKLAVGTL